MRILLVEDDMALRRATATGLREEGYIVDECADGEAALFSATTNDHDLVVLDVMLPIKNGLEACKEMRQHGVNASILMLTAKDALPDKIAGLDAGADDYLVKPFDFEELLARLRALLRRGSQGTAELIVGDLRLDPATHKVQRQGHTLALSAREFHLLELLMRHPDEVLSRARIAQAVWEGDTALDSNLVDVFISYLRAKVDKPFDVTLIHTVRGAGYVMRAPQQPQG